MAVTYTENEEEIVLNGVRYPIVGLVRESLSSIAPPKIVIGDTTRDSRQVSSVISVTDLRGGIGLEHYDGAVTVDRLWWSTSQTRYKGHQVLPALATATATSGEASVLSIPVIAELLNAVYVAFNLKVFKYNNVTDNWDSSVHTLPDTPVDEQVFTLAGTTYLAISTDTGYTYTSDGASWTDDSQDAKYLSFWDDKLWGITNAGQLWFSHAIGTETNDAILELPAGSVTGLFVARPGSGDTVLYAATKEGLYVHDFLNTRFIKTGLSLPKHPHNGLGNTVWRENIFISTGLSVYRYSTGSGGAVVSIVGPDRDDGLPAAYVGTIIKLIPTPNDLIAFVDGTAQSTAAVLSAGQAITGHISTVFGVPEGQSSILSWNELGWETTWISSSAAAPLNTGLVSTAYDKYRVWYGLGNTVYYIDLQANILNPRKVSTFRYALSSRTEYPWYNAAAEDLDSVALRVKIEVQGASSTETVKLGYQLDGIETDVTLGTITSDGVAVYDLPITGDTGEGVVFQDIRIVLDLARGDNALLSPDVRAVTLEFIKTQTAVFGYQFTIDIPRNGYMGQSPKEMRASLKTAAARKPLVNFNYKNNDNTQKWVRILQLADTNITGDDDSGTVTVSLVEV
jgi:hypothetical protein